MFFFTWLWALLVRLGLRTRNARVIILGLDNAGKTTLLYKLKHGVVKSFVPTQRALVETFRFGNVHFSACDLGGHNTVRHLWDEYCGECDAIVFVVDSGDTERLAEAADELWRVLELLREQAVPPAVAIMANKCDLKHAMADAELLRALKIEQYVGSTAASASGTEEREDEAATDEDANALIKMKFFRASLIRDVGFKEMFEWLTREC